MKLRFEFKTPDAFHEATKYLTPEQVAYAQSAIDKFIQYGECVRIEIDTVTETAIVIPRY